LIYSFLFLSIWDLSFLGVFYLISLVLLLFNLAFRVRDRKFSSFSLENLFIAPCNWFNFLVWQRGQSSTATFYCCPPWTGFFSPGRPFFSRYISSFFFKGRAFTLLFDFYSGSVWPLAALHELLSHGLRLQCELGQ